MRKLAIFCLVVTLSACGDKGESPEPEPTPDPTTSVPAPPPAAAPGDYLRIERVGSPSAGLYRDLDVELQINAWQGWRDPEYVAAHCPQSAADGSAPLFQLTLAGFREFARTGKALDDEGRQFQRSLWDGVSVIVNRRCNEPGQHPGFCSHTNVRKAEFKAFRDRLHAHLIQAQQLRDSLQGQPGVGTAYDSIAGWCNFRNER